MSVVWNVTVLTSQQLKTFHCNAFLEFVEGNLCGFLITKMHPFSFWKRVKMFIVRDNQTTAKIKPYQWLRLFTYVKPLTSSFLTLPCCYDVSNSIIIVIYIHGIYIQDAYSITITYEMDKPPIESLCTFTFHL